MDIYKHDFWLAAVLDFQYKNIGFMFHLQLTQYKRVLKPVH